MKAGLYHVSTQSISTVQKISTIPSRFLAFMKNAGDHELFKFVLDNQ